MQIRSDDRASPWAAPGSVQHALDAQLTPAERGAGGETEAEQDAVPVSSGSPGGKRAVSHVHKRRERLPGPSGRNACFADGYSVFPGRNSSRSQPCGLGATIPLPSGGRC